MYAISASNSKLILKKKLIENLKKNLTIFSIFNKTFQKINLLIYVLRHILRNLFLKKILSKIEKIYQNFFNF